MADGRPSGIDSKFFDGAALGGDSYMLDESSVSSGGIGSLTPLLADEGSPGSPGSPDAKLNTAVHASLAAIGVAELLTETPEIRSDMIEEALALSALIKPVEEGLSEMPRPYEPDEVNPEVGRFARDEGGDVLGGNDHNSEVIEKFARPRVNQVFGYLDAVGNLRRALVLNIDTKVVPAKYSIRYLGSDGVVYDSSVAEGVSPISEAIALDILLEDVNPVLIKYVLEHGKLPNIPKEGQLFEFTDKDGTLNRAFIKSIKDDSEPIEMFILHGNVGAKVSLSISDFLALNVEEIEGEASSDIQEKSIEELRRLRAEAAEIDVEIDEIIFEATRGEVCLSNGNKKLVFLGEKNGTLFFIGLDDKGETLQYSCQVDEISKYQVKPLKEEVDLDSFESTILGLGCDPEDALREGFEGSIRLPQKYNIEDVDIDLNFDDDSGADLASAHESELDEAS